MGNTDAEDLNIFCTGTLVVKKKGNQFTIKNVMLYCRRIKHCILLSKYDFDKIFVNIVNIKALFGFLFFFFFIITFHFYISSSCCKLKALIERLC